MIRFDEWKASRHMEADHGDVAHTWNESFHTYEMPVRISPPPEYAPPP